MKKTKMMRNRPLIGMKQNMMTMEMEIMREKEREKEEEVEVEILDHFCSRQ